MAAPLQMVEPVGSGYGGPAGRRGSRSGSKTSLEKTGGRTPERMSNEPDDPDEDNQWMPDHDPRDERGEFASRAQFLLTVIGFALGNGNYWHIPLAVRKFGGASFLLMYFICMAFFGVPMLYLEMMIGQIAQVGPMRAFQLNFPLFQGVGWAVCTVSFLRAVNYSLLNSFSLEYAVESLVGVTRRTTCNNEYNSKACFSHKTNKKYCKNSTLPAYWNNTCMTMEDRLKQFPPIELSAREFFRFNIRGVTAEFGEGLLTNDEAKFEFRSGAVMGCFCIVWFFACFCLLRRMRWLGKLSLFIVSSAGVLTFIFVIKLLCMQRSNIALQKLFSLRLKYFLEIDAWQTAFRLTRTSLCLGLGGMVSMSSYNKRSNDAFQDSVIVAFVVSMVSVMSGMSIYIMLSFMRHEFPFLNWVRAEKYVTGFMLYYVYYPELLGTFDFDALFSFLFYAMILALGISTFFGLLETPISALTDQFKVCRKHRSITILLLCLSGLGLGFVQTSKIGYHIFYTLDVRVVPLVSEIMVGFQLLTIVFYGPRNFYRDISASIGKKVNFFGNFLSPYGLVPRVCQFVISPAFLCGIVIHTHSKLFIDVWKRNQQLLNTVPHVPYVLGSLSFFPFPIILAGAVAAFVNNKKAGKPWTEVLHPHPMHPAIRYKVPPPLGCIFGLKPIEAMPSAMGDEKAVEFPEKAPIPAPIAPKTDGAKKEEVLAEL